MLEWFPILWFAILADSTDEVIKFVLGALFFLIWVVGGIVSAMKKRQHDERRRREQEEAWARQRGAMGQQQAQPPPVPGASQSWQEIYRDLTGAIQTGSRPQAPVPPPLPPALPPQAQPPAANRKKDRRGPRRKGAPAVAVPAAPAVPVVAPAMTGEVTDAIAASEARITGTEGRASAPAGRRVPQLNASSLRQQFILTEILRPPLALRDEEAGG